MGGTETKRARAASVSIVLLLAVGIALVGVAVAQLVVVDVIEHGMLVTDEAFPPDGSGPPTTTTRLVDANCGTVLEPTNHCEAFRGRRLTAVALLAIGLLLCAVACTTWLRQRRPALANVVAVTLVLASFAAAMIVNAVAVFRINASGG